MPHGTFQSRRPFHKETLTNRLQESPLYRTDVLYFAVSPRKSQRAVNVAYYWRNRDLEINRVRVRQDGMVEMLRDLRRVPCADCGQRFSPHQMDFDHRDPATKSFNVMTGRAMLMSTKKVLSEVAKCDVVCANCHRARTFAQIQKGRATAQLSGRSKRIEEKRVYWRRNQQLINRLREVPCTDCGQHYPPHVMEFDHRDARSKKARVSALIGRASVATILAEAAKCDVVCTNCHRVRTYERRQATFEREEFGG